MHADQPVLIVTTADDPHADALVAELRRRDIPVSRFHPEDFPVRSSITLFAAGDGPEWDGTIVTQGREVLLSSVRSAWYRRPANPVIDESVPPGLVEFARVNAREILNATYALIEDRWLTSPYALGRAQLKPVQLLAAARAGLATPLTIFSNDPGRARRFRDSLARNGTRCAVKAMRSTPTITYDRRVWLPYTAVWRDDAAPEAIADICLVPSIYQQYLAKRYEVRAVVIGEEIFAACVDPGTDPDSVIDVRKGNLAEHWVPYTLPDPTAAALIRLTRALGLHFCSADLIVTALDEVVFLELNPNGQWLWLDLCAGLPLTQKIADYLGAGIGPRAARSVA